METMLNNIAMIFVILILFAIFIFSLIGTWWMFEQTEIGRAFVKKIKNKEEK